MTPAKPAKSSTNGHWHAKAPKVLPGACKSAFQDKRYGVGRRLYTAMKTGWRCTVCHMEVS